MLNDSNYDGFSRWALLGTESIQDTLGGEAESCFLYNLLIVQ